GNALGQNGSPTRDARARWGGKPGAASSVTTLHDSRGISVSLLAAWRTLMAVSPSISVAVGNPADRGTRGVPRLGHRYLVGRRQHIGLRLGRGAHDSRSSLRPLCAIGVHFSLDLIA